MTLSETGQVTRAGADSCLDGHPPHRLVRQQLAPGLDPRRITRRAGR